MKNILSISERSNLLGILKARFEKNMSRHNSLAWNQVQARLEADDQKLWALQEMERTGGEPDVIGSAQSDGSITFYDCSAESPKGRRSFCYDANALDARKEFKPAGNVIETAAAIGIELLSEEQYRYLQQYGEFDTKTSSWLATPPAIRKHGGAIFGDRRYHHVFTYHNGAQSYYAARGFRGLLNV